MNKTIILFSCLIFCKISTSQMENWYKSDLGVLGYKHNTVKFGKPTSDELTFKGGSSDLSVDMYFEHTYFHLDASIVSDMLIWYAIGGNKNINDTWFVKDNIGRYDQAKFLPTRLAFGDNITPYFNLYAGGQWQYALYDFQSDNNQYPDMYLGGNQYGLGIHATFAYKNILARYSYMKDWISRASTFKGQGVSQEISLHYGWNFLGVFAKFQFQNLTMKEGTYPENYKTTFKKDLKTSTVYLPEQNMITTNFSIGIYAAGLFSGINNSSAKAVRDTEIRNRNERNFKKRNTIEWKE